MRNVLLIFLLLANIGFSQELKKLSKLPKVLFESSGLAILDNGLIATHNDGGGKSVIYMIDEDGKIQHELLLENTKNKDWEDISTNENGDLFVGDIGDNLNKRKHCSIYKVKKKDLGKKKITPKRIKFTYPEKHKKLSEDSLYFDAEAMFCFDDSIYIFTKNRTVPFDGKVLVYVIPQKPGTYKARLKTSFYLCNAGWQVCSVTAADYHKETDAVVFLTYKNLYVIKDFSKQTEYKPIRYNSGGLKQKEAVVFRKNGKSVLISDEKHKILGGGNLYKMKL